MIRFIYACAAIVVLSFLVIPTYYGIAGERESIQETAAVETSTQDDSLTFEEIYEIAAEGQSDETSLNQIAPAAGPGEPGDMAKNVFSTGFSRTTYPGLEDDVLVIEEEILGSGTPQ
jgi:hypothetical protein